MKTEQTKPNFSLTFDETQSTVLRKLLAEHHGATPFNRHITQDFRSLGIACCCLAHNLKLLSAEARNLAHSEFIMTCGEEDIRLLKDSLGAEAYDMALHILPRQAIALMKSRVRTPLKVETLESPEGFLKPAPASVLAEMSAAVDKLVERVEPPLADTPPTKKEKKTEAKKPSRKGRKQAPDAVDANANQLTFADSQLGSDGNVVLEAWRTLGGYAMQSEIIDEVATREGKDSMSSEKCRRTIKRLTGSRYLKRIDVERQGRRTVALDLGEKGKDFMTARYGNVYPSTLRGNYLHNYACHRVAMTSSVQLPDAKVTIGDTQSPKQTEGVSEFDVTALLPDGQLHVFEIDVAAGNLSQERIDAICQVADKLTLVTLKEQVKKLKQFENNQVTVETIARYNLSRKELQKLAANG